MFKLLFILIIYCAIINADIRTNINKYFKSDNCLKFQKLWQPHRKYFENAIELALKDGFGEGDMNIYIRRSKDSLLLSDGVYVDDNIVKIILSNMYLTQLPRLVYPDVTFALASNVLRLETGLRRMIIKANYSIFRSDDKKITEQDPSKTSPFGLQQVMGLGNLVIIAEECNIVGYILTRLYGNTVVLGYDSFHVTDCQFSVEITTHNSEAPPVIAPYFGTKQAQLIEKLLTKPIREELLAVLQAAMYTYINTSVVLGADLPKLLKSQDEIFTETIQYVNNLVRSANMKTVEIKRVAEEMGPFSLQWLDVVNDERMSVLLKTVTLYGLDSLHSAHIGGPYKMQETGIGETLRFSSLLIRGDMVFEKLSLKKNNEFVAELKDVEVHIEFFDLERGFKRSFEIMNWRSLEVSVKSYNIPDNETLVIKSIVLSYIGLKLPEILEKHITLTFGLTDQAAPSDDTGIHENENDSFENSSKKKKSISDDEKIDDTKESQMSKNIIESTDGALSSDDNVSGKGVVKN